MQYESALHNYFSLISKLFEVSENSPAMQDVEAGAG
jgi:hypothetical protein